MRCLSAEASVEKSVLLASAILTCDVNGRPVDMVKAFKSLEPWDTVSTVMVYGFNLLDQVPDLVVGLPGVEHVDLSTEELKELHEEIRTNTQLRGGILKTESECLHAIAQVCQRHPTTCGASAEIGQAISKWVEGIRTLGKTGCCTYPETDATKIEDLEFMLIALFRFLGKDVHTHVTVPSLQQCNPNAAIPGAWECARFDLDARVYAPTMTKIYATALSQIEYDERMGKLAVPIKPDHHYTFC
ncbi:hypothetical protein GNI_172150 [Gregarina niphandrodes]|uniref:Uncharacterized protein n=1 Tax=Gregarina niphandrodes TaxID=110365 RepID=A0A023AXR2_GRENI|nr:hypothetical protein GNI_172150 [Gregarina niphandrodes]EZG43436.1 hypothetical protein GNI_172150 [Gregarina niphandrodes]|eukprot:XP_011133334.1 hypothetical protein GNI_172150 [Gregarina niphandrodes]